MPPYAQYVLVNRQAVRPWQVVLAGWPRPRERRPSRGQGMVPNTRHTWPPYDPADPDPPYPFAIHILQRIPGRLHHFRITVFPRRIASMVKKRNLPRTTSSVPKGSAGRGGTRDAYTAGPGVMGGMGKRSPN